MNVIDSSGWLEYFSDSPNAKFFSKVIEDTDNLLVPTICIYEVSKRMTLIYGKTAALQSVGIMSLGKIIDLNRQISLNASKISIEFKLAMADSIILATAQLHHATLWTQDEHFKNLEHVKYIEKK
jgi:toxin FitB